MPNSTQTAFTAPHYAASQVGQQILEHGGTAIEAMVAAAASIAVVYPHMNGLGGDGFWLISEPGKKPFAIDASGTAAAAATPEFYCGYQAIPSRGGKAALTMAGAVAGWQQALNTSANWQTPMALSDLLATATAQAKWGIEVTQSLYDASDKTFAELSQLPGFEQFSIKSKHLRKGKILKLPLLADTLEHLAKQGLNSFYQGDIAKALSEDLAAAGSPITRADFEAYQAKLVTPLSAKVSAGHLYNLPAPTQGVASLLILALFDRVKHLATDEQSYVHLLVECTKQAFMVRNQYLTDESRLTHSLDTFLSEEKLEDMKKNIDINKAMAWPHSAKPGDTVWMGACDNQGRMVSYIQSLYWEFGSGVVSAQTGVTWNNRGTSFSLEPDSLQYLQPGLKPFHTLNPAYAELNDGRRIVYGTMGGEGQPQTQAAILTRHVFAGLPVQEAIAEGRWLLGKTWGDESHNLKLEQDIADKIGPALAAKGHDIAVVNARNELMGHAGMISLDTTGLTEAASDPRSDGRAFTGN